VEVDLPIEDGDALVDLFGTDDQDLPAKLRLAPHAAHWFRVRRGDGRMPP
jgi:maltose alpha-D-glucosyltransferase/alpha-amylase